MEKGKYQSSDLRLSAYLHSEGFKIVKLTKMGARVVFEFEDSPDRASTVNKFYNHEAKVDPLKYTDAMSTLRDMIRLADTNATTVNGG